MTWQPTWRLIGRWLERWLPEAVIPFWLTVATVSSLRGWRRRRRAWQALREAETSGISYRSVGTQTRGLGEAR